MNISDVGANTKEFNDVKMTDWYYYDITSLVEKGIADGYEDGSFKPNALVTRAQASKIITNAVKYQKITYDEKRNLTVFKDVSEDSWFYPYVSFMYENRIIDGYNDGSFKPSTYITRAQSSKLISESFKMVGSDVVIPFKDVNKDDWYGGYVRNLYVNKVSVGSGNLYHPQSNLTRGQLMAFVSRSMSWYESNIAENSYSLIKDSLLNMDSEGTFDTSEISQYEVNRVLQKVLRENPEITYYKTAMIWNNGRMEYKYTLPYEEMVNRNNIVDKKAEDILKSIIKPGFTDFEKVKAIHDYIVINSEYDYENYKKGTVPEESYNAYGSLINGIAVCDGYTKAAIILLNKLGIDNNYVIGYANGGLHSWNQVKINGEYYFMDITFDDPVPDVKGKIRYDYFLVSSDELRKDHSWIETDYPVSKNNFKSK